MKLIDYAPNVLEALRNGEQKQTDLTELVFGSSGRGNTSLTNSLFPLCVRRGWIALTERGRSKIYSLTPLGLSLLGNGDPHANWDFETHSFKS